MAFAMPRARIRVWSRLTSAWLLASEVVQAVHRGILEKNLGGSTWVSWPTPRFRPALGGCKFRPLYFW
jgi:hypothetical protein